MRRIASLLAALVTFVPVAGMAGGQAAPKHPIIGAWKILSKDGKCSETYRFRSNGTMTVLSGDEITEVMYEIAAEPSSQGFYRWTHRIVSSNGKKDCSGKVTEAGQSFTWFVQFDASKQQLLVCKEESLQACFGPLRRQREVDT